MDQNPANNPNTNNSQTIAAAASPVSAGVPGAGPKVFDLSSINSLNSSGGGGGAGNFFKKKPFIIGVLSVLVLAIAGITIFTISQRKVGPGPQPKAETCPSKASDVTVEALSVSEGRGDKAFLTGRVHNNCGNPVKVKLQKFWCSEVEKADGACGRNGSTEIKEVAAGATEDFTIEQAVGNTGTCGSAQVDLDIDTSKDLHIEGLGAAAFLDACGPPPGTIKCDTLHLTPEVTTVKASQEIRLKVDRSGGTGSWKTTEWTITTEPATGNKGTTSRLTGDSVYWKAPATLTSSQSWTFTGTVVDSSGAKDSSGCTKTVSFATATPPPPPSTYSHNVCNANKACVSLPCSPADVDCSASTDCTTSADCNTTTYKFTTCENNTCVSKDCPDPNTECAQDTDCTSDNDCKTTTPPPPPSSNTHRACQNNACVTVDGAGADSCTSDASCQPAATPPPIPESGNTALTLGAAVIGAIALLGGLFLAL